MSAQETNLVGTADAEKALGNQYAQGIGGAVQGLMPSRISDVDMQKHNLLSGISTSMQRISQACDALWRGEKDTLTRADVDNAIRHAGQLTRKLREVKKVVYPQATPAPKATTEQQ